MKLEPQPPSRHRRVRLRQRLGFGQGLGFEHVHPAQIAVIGARTGDQQLAAGVHPADVLQMRVLKLLQIVWAIVPLDGARPAPQQRQIDGDHFHGGVPFSPNQMAGCPNADLTFTRIYSSGEQQLQVYCNLDSAREYSAKRGLNCVMSRRTIRWALGLLVSMALYAIGLSHGIPRFDTASINRYSDWLNPGYIYHPDEFAYVGIPYRMLVTREWNPHYYHNPPLNLYTNLAFFTLIGADNLPHDEEHGDREIASFNLYFS